MDDSTEPVCKDLPVGVKSMSSGTTVLTFELEKGYWRTSHQSSVILKCYNEEACLGGDQEGSCAPGYGGPGTCVVCGT